MGGLRGKAWWWGLCVERWGFEDLAHGVKRVSVTLVRKGTKKKKKNITCVPANGALAVVGVGAKGRMRRWHGACMPVDGVVWSSLLCTLWQWSLCNGSRYGNGSSTTLKEEKVK